MYPMGPIMDGGALNMTVMSYMGQLNFGLVACADVAGDLDVLAAGLHEAMAELSKAADTA